MALGASMTSMLRSGCYLNSLMCVMSLFLVCIIYFIFFDSLWLIESLIVFFLMSDYFVCTLFENILNSFPDNDQIFFILSGVFFV